MIKKLLLILFILSLFISALAVYLNKVYLPVKVKSLIVEGIEGSIGRKAALRAIKLNILKGLVLEDLTIFGQDPKTEPVFLKIKQLSVGWLILPFLKQKQVIIPLVNIYSLELNLQRRRDNALNVPLLKQGMDKAPKGFPLIIYKVNIQGAKINFTDELVTPSYSQSALLNLTLSFSLPKMIRYSLSGNLENSDKSPVFLEAKGSFDLGSKELSSAIKAENLNLESIVCYCKEVPFHINKGIIQKLEGNAAFKDDIVKVSLKADVSKLAIEKEGIDVQGNAKLNVVGAYNVKTGALLDYSGDIIADRVDLSGLPYINKADDLSGKASFSTDKVELSNFKVNALGALFELAGSLTNFQDPHLKFKAASESVGLEKIEAFLAENKLVKLPLKAEGEVKIDLTFALQVLAPQDAKIEGEAILKDNKLSLLRLKQGLSGISGKVSFNNDVIEWKDITGKFKDIKYNSSGAISDFSSPNIKFDLVSQVLNLKASGKLKDNTVAIKELQGKYLNSEFDASGSAILSEAAPQVDIDADIKCSLEDFQKIFSDYSPENLPLLDKINAKGICNIKLALSGKLNDIKALTVKASLESGALTAFIMGKQQIKFDNLRLDVIQKDRQIQEFNVVSDLYGGKLNLTADADLTPQQPEFNLQLEVVNLDLAKLKEETTLKDKTISGILSANLSLGGRMIDTTSYLGKGMISIKEGNLWEIAPFKKLGQFLVIPSFENIVFNEANADLIIEEGNVFSDEGVLKSPQVTLYCHGKVDFKGNLDYIIKSEFNPEIVRDSSDLMQILSSAISKVNQFTTVKLTGTIDKPKLSIIPAVFESIKQIIK
ncbi:MAG: AsmA-like C-terminal region-containing protein [Candidatus Omnitrophota bacterium]